MRSLSTEQGGAAFQDAVAAFFADEDQFSALLDGLAQADVPSDALNESLMMLATALLANAKEEPGWPEQWCGEAPRERMLETIASLSRTARGNLLIFAGSHGLWRAGDLPYLGRCLDDPTACEPTLHSMRLSGLRPAGLVDYREMLQAAADRCIARPRDEQNLTMHLVGLLGPMPDAWSWQICTQVVGAQARSANALAWRGIATLLEDDTSDAQLERVSALAVELKIRPPRNGGLEFFARDRRITSRWAAGLVNQAQTGTVTAQGEFIALFCCNDRSAMEALALSGTQLSPVAVTQLLRYHGDDLASWHALLDFLKVAPTVECGTWNTKDVVRAATENLAKLQALDPELYDVVDANATALLDRAGQSGRLYHYTTALVAELER